MIIPLVGVYAEASVVPSSRVPAATSEQRPEALDDEPDDERKDESVDEQARDRHEGEVERHPECGDELWRLGEGRVDVRDSGIGQAKQRPENEQANDCSQENAEELEDSTPRARNGTLFGVRHGCTSDGGSGGANSAPVHEEAARLDDQSHTLVVRVFDNVSNQADAIFRGGTRPARLRMLEVGVAPPLHVGRRFLKRHPCATGSHLERVDREGVFVPLGGTFPLGTGGARPRIHLVETRLRRLLADRGHALGRVHALDALAALEIVELERLDMLCLCGCVEHVFLNLQANLRRFLREDQVDQEYDERSAEIQGRA